MAQITWVPYTTLVDLGARAAKAPQRALPFLAQRLRWVVAAGVVLLAAPGITVLSVGGVGALNAGNPAAIAQLADQARNILSTTNYQVTLPLSEATVTPPPPPPTPVPTTVNRATGAAPPPAAVYPAGSIQQIIAAAAAQYGVSYSWLLSTAECESGLNPYAVNRSSGATGLFQFMPATFYGHGGTDIWSPVQQSDIAAKMFSIGESSEWTCA